MEAADCRVTDDIRYVGVNDHEIDLFESQFAVPRGMAYNSYVILDDKIAVMDATAREFGGEWLANIERVTDGKAPSYLIVQHMEPDHSYNIQAFVEKYPDAQVVGNAKTFAMIGQFYGLDSLKKIVVKNGDTLELGHHTLTFIFAPMIHWPEVMMTWDSRDKVFFSADAFGKFGANDVEDPDGWACEARRYYFGIVGKYGMQVQTLLKKISCLEMKTICSLHGPVLTGDLSEYLNLYLTWSAYKPEEPGVTIAYSSVYGNTREAALRLADMLKAGNCPNVSVFDVSRDDIHEAVEDAFRYSKLVLATTTYNADIFPTMRTFIENLTERNYQNRTVALIENGSWAPMAAKVMRALLEKSKNITFAETTVTLKSALNAESEEALRKLADELCRDWQ